MNRRDFVLSSASLLFAEVAAKAFPPTTAHDVHLHRFGVNYTPSEKWWYCWDDWTRDSIQRDLDAIATLGADHLRILLVWPSFQPNATWVSPAHVERLSDLLHMMAQRRLDAVVTVFTGQLSGLRFLPPFTNAYDHPSSTFYTDDKIWKAQELFIRTLSAEMAKHGNIIGFDFGNEVNTCWQAAPEIGDAWMKKMYALMNSTLPRGLHVNGIDHQPWFHQTTFSTAALAAQTLPTIHCYPYWTGALKYGKPMDPPSTKLIAAMASLVRSYAGDPQKPIWCEEFNTCIEALEEPGQALWLEKAVTSAIENGVGWFTYWDSHDVNRRFQFASMEYSLGLLTNDGRVKRQGEVFRDLAKTYAGKPVAIPAKPPLPAPSEHTDLATWQWLLDWMEWKPANA